MAQDDKVLSDPQSKSSSCQRHYTTDLSKDDSMPDPPAIMLDRLGTMKHMETFEGNQMLLNQNLATLAQSIAGDINDRKEETNKSNEREDTMRNLIQELANQRKETRQMEAHEPNIECNKCDKLKKSTN